MSYHCWFNTTSSVTKTLTVSTTDAFLPISPPPPKEKYYWQPLTLLVFATSLQKTQLVTNRYIVSTNTTSNQQGRLRIEPPTSTCRQDIRGCLRLTPFEPQGFKKTSSQRWQLNQILQVWKVPKTDSLARYVDLRMYTFLYVYIHRNQLVPQFRQNQKNETISKHGFFGVTL